MADYNRDRSGDQGRGGRKFNGAGRGFGKPSFGRGGGRDEYRPQMHKTTCDECGDQCEVPFRPSGDKPVFCRDCFDDVGGGNDRPQRKDSFRDRGDRNDRGDRGDKRKEFHKDQSHGAPKEVVTKEQFEALNAKVDKILKLITPVISVSKEKHAEVSAKMEKAEAKKVEAKKPEAKAEVAAVKAPKAKKAAPKKSKE